jgi:hypothetical protein
MTTTDEFFNWFFTGLNGLGGWFLFLILALAAVVWLLYDTQKRHLSAFGWKMGVILLTCLIVPAMIWRFASADTQLSLAQFMEAIFYLGLLGGVLPPVLAGGYFVTFRGMMGCPQGHVFEAVLGKCPECAALERPISMPMPVPEPQPVWMPSPAPNQPVEPPAPVKPKTQAWLVSSDGRSYQLNCGETTIGRQSSNDIYLSGDNSVHRQHAKIIEQNGHFRLLDLGGSNNTRLNKRVLRQPALLEPDDEIQFGDNTTVRFVTARR